MNLIGKRFGRLVVIEKAAEKGYVICRCDCGFTKPIRATSLTKQTEPTRSCGCLQREFAVEHGHRVIGKNSREQIETNVKFNTNFQVIENPVPPKNNTSGYKGVSWNATRRKWEAYINVHGRRISLGRHERYEDAVQARLKAEQQHFAPLIEQKEAEMKGDS